jgi:hypothetical protein
MSLHLEAACELALIPRTVGQTFNVRPSTKDVIELSVRVPSPLQAYPFAPEGELTYSGADSGFMRTERRS